MRGHNPASAWICIYHNRNEFIIPIHAFHLTYLSIIHMLVGSKSGLNIDVSVPSYRAPASPTVRSSNDTQSKRTTNSSSPRTLPRTQHKQSSVDGSLPSLPRVCHT